MADKSYKASQTDWHFGGSSFLANLSPHIDGTAVLTGNTTVIRRKARDGTGRRGQTADGGNLGFQATIPVRLHAEVLKVVDNPEGVLFIHRKDANYAYAIPAICDAQQITSEEDGVVMYQLTFNEGETDSTSDIGSSVAGVPTTTAGQRQVTSGREGYIRTATNIVRHEATFTQTADTVAVIGAPLVAEGGP